MIPQHLMMAKPPLFTGAVCAYPWDPALANQFTVASRFEGQEPMRLWNRFEADGKDLIGLPWHCCPIAPDDRRTDGFKVQLASKVKPKTDDQARVIKETKAFLKAGLSGQVSAPTGSGKTVVGLDVICEIGVTTCVIVPKEDLMDQWIERILQFTNLRRPEIGVIRQDMVNVRGRPIVLASLQSVSKPGRYPAWVYNSFGLLVADECHRLGADLLGEVARMFTARRRLGLSATNKRTDGKDLQIEAHLGPIRVTAEAKPLKATIYILQTEWRCPRTKTGERIPHKAGRTAHILKFLTQNIARNKLICRAAALSYSKGRNLVIFSDAIDHLEELEQMLQGPKYRIPASQIGRYYGSTTKAQLDHAAGCRVKMATYAKMGEGTDIPEIDTLIFGTPRVNVKQALGRMLRECATKRPPVAFDIVDPDSPVFAGYARQRYRLYQAEGHDVEEAELPEAEAA